MGGRGASGGVSKKGNVYGTQYHTLLQVGNILFVSKNERTSETLMETRTPGRVYVTVGGGNLLQIIYTNTHLKRTKTIDLGHMHDGKVPHVHHGYEHNEEDSAKGYARLTPKEKKMVDEVKRIWYNQNGK